MQPKNLFSEPCIPAGFYWFHEPQCHRFEHGLEIISDPKTDFWQRTHYGFCRDDGHCLLTRLEGNFSVTAQVRFAPTSRFDQCGLMVRVDEENWIKFSTELESHSISRLGSVVTNLGYSDWATQDVPSSLTERWYRIQRMENDFLLESSEAGADWKQVRIAHLHRALTVLEAGVYACSPIGDGFGCSFPFFSVEASRWETEPA